MFIITKKKSYTKIIIYFQRAHKFDDIFIAMKLNGTARRVREQQNVCV